MPEAGSNGNRGAGPNVVRHEPIPRLGFDGGEAAPGWVATPMAARPQGERI
jgi:hypothetical protein